jgi:hypothetical protein
VGTTGQGRGTEARGSIGQAGTGMGGGGSDGVGGYRAPQDKCWGEAGAAQTAVLKSTIQGKKAGDTATPISFTPYNKHVYVHTQIKQ